MSYPYDNRINYFRNIVATFLILLLATACGPANVTSPREIGSDFDPLTQANPTDSDGLAIEHEIPAASAPQLTNEAQLATNKTNEAQTTANQVAAGKPAVLLEEDFSGSSLGPEWEPVWGEWEVANGRLAPVDSLSGAKIFVGDPRWQDYTISVKLDPTTDEYGGSVIVRAEDADNQLKALFFKSENTQGTGWWRITDKSLEDVGDSFVEMDLSRPPYTLTVVALGDYYAFYVGQELVSEFRDSTFRTGRIGFESWRDGDDPPEPNLSTFDNLIIYEGDARAALGLQPSQSDVAKGTEPVVPTAVPPLVDISDAEFAGSIGSFHYAVSEVTFGTQKGDLSSLGTFAMVTNTGTTNPYLPMLEMQLFDVQGNMVGSGTGQILYIPSGATVPVAFFFEVDRPPFASYSISGIDEGIVQYYEPVQAEVVPVGFQQTPCTTYTITNTDSKVATEVIVSQRYFDAEGTMIDLKTNAHRVVEPGTPETGECFHNLPNTILTVVAYQDPVNPRLDNKPLTGD